MPPFTPFEEISVASENEDYISVDGVLFTRDKKTLLLYPASKKRKVYQFLMELSILTIKLLSLQRSWYRTCN